MTTTDLTPGAITTLGQLRPGDVGEYAGNDERFIVVKNDSPPWVRIEYADGQRSVKTSSLIVRYLGRGRLEPARIVMDGETDETMGIIADLRRKLAEAGVEGSPPPGRDTTIGQWSNRAHNAEEQVRTLREAIEYAVSQDHAGTRLRAALAAPTEETPAK